MTLTVNGRPREVPAGCNLSRFLEAIGIDRRMVALAVNGEVVPRDRYEATSLTEGDRVEVVRMVGGG
jgi:thiamine biosynthesis protein ThiS